MQVNLNDLPEVLLIDYLNRHPAILIGRHGIGKSWYIKNDFPKLLKEKLNLDYLPEVYDLRPREHDDAEIGGFPRVIQNNGYEEGQLKYSLPIFWREDLEDKVYIIFIDELHSANTLQQKELFKLLDSRMVHDRPLGEKWWVVAAANPADGNYTIISDIEDDMAFRRRFSIYNVYVTVDDAIAWWKKNNINPIIIDFITKFPEELQKGVNCPASFTKLAEFIDTMTKTYQPDKEKATRLVEIKAGSLLEKGTVRLFIEFFSEAFTETFSYEEILQYPKNGSREKLQNILKRNRNDIIQESLDILFNRLTVEDAKKHFKNIHEFIMDLPPELPIGFLQRMLLVDRDEQIRVRQELFDRPFLNIERKKVKWPKDHPSRRLWQRFQYYAELELKNAEEAAKK